MTNPCLTTGWLVAFFLLFAVIAGCFASEAVLRWHDYLRWLRERKGKQATTPGKEP